MRKPTRLLIPTLAAAALLSACGSSSSSSTSSSAPSASSTGSGAQVAHSSSGALVKTASNSKLGGMVLVDTRGLTLYRLSGEQNGKFICTSSACLQAWHPVAAQPGSKPSGAVSSLSTVKRPDGTLQITYKGMPLYTFAQDMRAGQANGQGIKDVGTWNAVTTGSAAAAAAAATAAPAPAAPASSGGGGYAY
jgi:predicted lipoprotein with Yx(FWY)xxD motif